MPSKLVFKNCVVSIAGDLDDHDWREEKVKQWVQYGGGIFSSIVDGNVTHLLCTRENFKKKIADVRVALKNKGTKIVMRDWLEDSINKEVCLKTLPYQLDEEARQEEAKKRRIQKMQECSKNAVNYVDERYWHIYRDCTNFQYQIQLKRDDKESGNVGEKHVLTLWESNAKPCNYRCTTLFTKKSKNKASKYAINETPVDLKTGLKTFERFFKKRTSIEWDDRIEKMGTTGPEHFQYQPPGGGKPVGLLKGRRASIFSEGDRINTPNQTSKKEQHNDTLVEYKGLAETYRKRAREEHVADDDISNVENEERPVKKSRLEIAETDCLSVEAEADSARDITGADSICESKSQSEEDIQGVQICDEPVNEEVTQDLDIAQYLLEFGNVINDGTLEPAFDFNEQESEHENHLEYNSEGESNSPELTAADDDGAVPSCNSEAGDEENREEYETVEDEDEDEDEDNDDDEEISDAPRENTEQEAHDISKMYDEVQHASIDEDYVHDDDVGDDDYAPEAIQARRLAREISTAAENIYHERRRGVSLVQNSQAQLIDAVCAQEAYICARAKRIKEREEREDAEDAEEENMAGLWLDGSMD